MYCIHSMNHIHILTAARLTIEALHSLTSDPDLYVVGTKEKLPVQVRLLNQVIISDGDLGEGGREAGREGGKEAGRKRGRQGGREGRREERALEGCYCIWHE